MPDHKILVALRGGLRPAPVWGGIVIQADEILTLGPGSRVHMRTGNGCRWATVVVEARDLALCGRALAGDLFAIPMRVAVLAKESHGRPRRALGYPPDWGAVAETQLPGAPPSYIAHYLGAAGVIAALRRRAREGAIAVASTVYMILDLSGPYSGMFRASSAPLEQVLAAMGKE